MGGGAVLNCRPVSNQVLVGRNITLQGMCKVETLLPFVKGLGILMHAVVIFPGEKRLIQDR